MEEEIQTNIENRIIKNTSYFTLALIMQKIVSFVYFSYLATQLGSESTGKYFFALSFTAMFSVFIDLGLGNLIVRESAKQENSQKLLSNAISIKLITSIFVFLVIYIFSNVLNYPEATKTLIYLSSIAIILDNFTLIFFSTIRGKHNLKYESIASILFQIIVMVVGYITLQKTHDPYYLVLVLILASSFNVLFSLIIVNFVYKLSIIPKIDTKFIKKLLIMAWPFAVMAIFTKIFGSADSVLLSKLSDEKSLGYYSIPYKITFAFQFIPMAFSASLYPAFTHLFNYQKEKLKNILEKSISYLILISLPITIGIIVIAREVTLKIYGIDFLPSTTTLQILIINLPFIFLSFPTGALLNSANMQKKHTKNIAVAMIFSIILNIILIPLYKQNGAAIASVISSIVYVSLNFITCSKIIRISYKNLTLVSLKTLIACLIMVFMIILLNNHINWLLKIASGGAMYIFCSILLKTVTKEDFVLLKRGFKQ